MLTYDIVWNGQHIVDNFSDGFSWDKVVYFDKNMHNIRKGLHNKLCLTPASLNLYENIF